MQKASQGVGATGNNKLSLDNFGPRIDNPSEIEKSWRAAGQSAPDDFKTCNGRRLPDRLIRTAFIKTGDRTARVVAQRKYLRTGQSESQQIFGNFDFGRMTPRLQAQVFGESHVPSDEGAIQLLASFPGGQKRRRISETSSPESQENTVITKRTKREPNDPIPDEFSTSKYPFEPEGGTTAAFEAIEPDSQPVSSGRDESGKWDHIEHVNERKNLKPVSRTKERLYPSRKERDFKAHEKWNKGSLDDLNKLKKSKGLSKKFNMNPRWWDKHLRNHSSSNKSFASRCSYYEKNPKGRLY